MPADPTTPPAGRGCVVCHTEHATIAEAQACGKPATPTRQDGPDLDNHRRRLEDACRLAQSSDVEHLRAALNSATITAGDLLADAYKLRDEVEHLRAAPSTQPTTPDDDEPRQLDLKHRMAAAIPYSLISTPAVGLGDARRLMIAEAVEPVVLRAVDAGREDLTRRIAELEEAVRQMTFERDLACDVADQARAERDVQQARADRLIQQLADLQGQLAITKGGNT